MIVTEQLSKKKKGKKLGLDVCFSPILLQNYSLVPDVWRHNTLTV